MDIMDIKRPAPRTKRPEGSKPIFHGVIFDVYQWKQKLFNGNEETFEMLKRPDTVDVIPITPEGKIVIIHEEQPAKGSFTSFPGGRVEPGEPVIEAAKRELLEETGYRAETMEPWFAVQPVSKIDWAIYFLIAKGCVRRQDQMLDGGEKIKVEEISFDRLIELASEGKLVAEDVCVKVLQAKLDPQKMAELKKLFSP